MRTAFFIVLVLIFSLSVGFLVFSLTNMHFMVSESQGPYDYNVKFGEGIEAKDLGVVVNMNLSFVKTWFVGEEKNVSLEVSAEKVSNIVQNFSWQIFWIKLFTVREGKWKNIVAHGSSFLKESEWSDAYLYKRQDVSVGVVNLNYLESAHNAWFRIGIMMDIYQNNTEYSLTFYTPVGEIGPVAVLSPLYSPISLVTISTAIIAISATLAHQLLSKIASRKKHFPRVDLPHPLTPLKQHVMIDSERVQFHLARACQFCFPGFDRVIRRVETTPAKVDTAPRRMKRAIVVGAKDTSTFIVGSVDA